MQGLLMLKGIYIKKDQRELRVNLKNKHRY